MSEVQWRSSGLPVTEAKDIKQSALTLDADVVIVGSGATGCARTSRALVPWAAVRAGVEQAREGASARGGGARERAPRAAACGLGRRPW